MLSGQRACIRKFSNKFHSWRGYGSAPSEVFNGEQEQRDAHGSTDLFAWLVLADPTNLYAEFIQNVAAHPNVHEKTIVSSDAIFVVITDVVLDQHTL